MGIEKATGGSLYIITPNGEYQRFIGLTSVETSSAAVGYDMHKSLSLPSSIEFSGTLRWCDKRISRKRLIKLLVSRGIQKLAAQEIAWNVNKSPMTYQSYWINYVMTGDLGIYVWVKS